LSVINDCATCIFAETDEIVTQHMGKSIQLLSKPVTKRQK